jgi:pimeloyl-ACP methyl ester carboxylesterase
MPERIDHGRRRFVGTAVAGLAAASLGAIRRILEGIGHNVPQEAPDAFAKAVVDVDGHTT